MKASQLRIGNYVQLETNNPYKIEPHHFVLNEDGYNECLDLSIPIPLTEEWLVKFGFENDNTQWYSKKEPFGLEIIVSIENNSIDIDEGNEYVRLQVPPNSVHQLQNLYFALCGEELTIK